MTVIVSTLFLDAFLKVFFRLYCYTSCNTTASCWNWFCPRNWQFGIKWWHQPVWAIGPHQDGKHFLKITWSNLNKITRVWIWVLFFLLGWHLKYHFIPSHSTCHSPQNEKSQYMVLVVKGKDMKVLIPHWKWCCDLCVMQWLRNSTRDPGSAFSLHDKICADLT